MLGGPNNDEGPAEFLQGLGKSLAEQAGADTDLAKILADNILQDPQKPQSVAEATQAIAALAVARAKAADR